MLNYSRIHFNVHENINLSRTYSNSIIFKQQKKGFKCFSALVLHQRNPRFHPNRHELRRESNGLSKNGISRKLGNFSKITYQPHYKREYVFVSSSITRSAQLSSRYLDE